MLANVVLVNVLVPGVSWNYVIMVVPQMLGDLGLEIGNWGFLWSAIALGVVLFSIPGGILGDRIGARLSVGAGVALIGVSLLLRSRAVDFSSAFLSMVLFGLALGLVFATLAKAIALWFPPEELGMANGVSQAGIGLGLGAATLSTPMLLEPLGGWRGISIVLGYVMLGLSTFWLLAVRDPAPISGANADRSRTSGSIARLLSVRDLRALALCNFLFFGGYLGAFGYLPTYFTTVQGMSAQAAGGVATLGGWAFVLGSVLLPTLSDRIGRRKIVYVASIFTNGIVVLLEAYLLGLSLALAALIWGTVAGAVVLLFVVPVEMEDIGPALAGSATGVINTAGFAGGVIAPLVGMLLVPISPVLGLAFWASCYVLSALCFATIRETGRRR